MDCLTKSQILDYFRGNKSELFEKHLADCASCREQLLTIVAEQNRDSNVPTELADKTIKSIISKRMMKKEKPMPVKRFVFPLSVPSLVKFAAAACLAAAILVGYYFIQGSFQHYAALKKHAVSPSIQSGKNGRNFGGKNEVFPETVVVENNGMPRKNTVLVFDSITINVGKIPVARDREALVRFGKETGIAAGPAAVINVKARSDTTALIELTKGSALFSIEKNKYKEFVVQTPTVRIVVTGTVFSVMADSAYTMVNVMEGSVRLQHQNKSTITTTLLQGSGAFANSDSIIRVMIENSQLLKAREKLLREYIEGTMFKSGSHALPGSSAETMADRQTSADKTQDGTEKFRQSEGNAAK